MTDDPVVDEVRRVRKEISARFGHDVEKYFAHLREYEKELRARGFVFADDLKPKVAPKE